MRWNCPYCQSQLKISDDQIGPGWSFTRCDRCAGFALIKPAEVQMVKIEKAPPGERILTPESLVERPISTAKPAAALNHTEPQLSATLPPRAPKMPKPLPEINEVSSSKRKISFVSFIMGAAGVTAVASGIYLYIQGQALWNKAKAESVARTVEIAQGEPAKEMSRRNLEREEFAIRIPAAAIQVQTPIMEAPPKEVLAATEIAPETKAPEIAPVVTSQSGVQKILRVRPRNESINLRSGPGLEYGVIGTATRNDTYVVSDWDDRWFKIVLEASRQRIAWVRNDMVEIIR